MGDMLSLIRSTSRPRRSTSTSSSSAISSSNNKNEKKKMVTVVDMPILEKTLEEHIQRIKDKLACQETLFDRLRDQLENLHDGMVVSKRELDQAMDEKRKLTRMRLYADTD